MRTRNNNDNNDSNDRPVNKENKEGSRSRRNAYGETIKNQSNEAKAPEQGDSVKTPSENKRRGRRFGTRKPQDQKVQDQKVQDQKPQDQKVQDQKPQDQQVQGRNPQEQKRQGRKPQVRKPQDQKVQEQMPQEQKAQSEGAQEERNKQVEGTRAESRGRSGRRKSQETDKPAERQERKPRSQSRAPRRGGHSRGMSWNKPKEEPVNYTTTNPSNKDIVRIMPLGGIGEIGKNMTAIEYLDEIVIIDCGLKFPEDDQLGIDIVIPDVTFLKDNAQKIKGFFITHGHEDHIGALPYVLKQVNVPVYSTKLPLGLIEIKLREHNIFDKVKMNIVKAGDTINYRHLKVEFVKTNHSIADASAIVVHTPDGAIVHTGDFKVDLTPVDGGVIDLARFAQLGTEGVLALMADSTNVERPGSTRSESTIGENFEKIFLRAKGRIIVATFSSNIHRIQQIAEVAVKLGRKCVFNGRSMENVVGVARELGYLHVDDKNIISVDDINRYRDDQVVIMTTGSQGEPMAALSRMAIGEHRKIRIKQGDMVILSSHPIPGNEKSVSRTINLLYKLGAEVIYEAKEDVHVSGHAQQDELKLMHALTKPKYFIPVHGEYRHLSIHAELAKTMGMEQKNILIPENGDIIELSKERIRKNGKVQTGQILVDGLSVGDVGNVVLRDRKHLSEDGILTVVVTVDSESGTVIAGPDIISRGFVYIKESEKLMNEVRSITKKILSDNEGKKMQNIEFVNNQIKDGLRNFLYRKTQRNPMILPVIMEI